MTRLDQDQEEQLFWDRRSVSGIYLGNVLNPLPQSALPFVQHEPHSPLPGGVSS